MAAYRLTLEVFIESGEGPEEVAQSMSNGAPHTLRGFPDGEVVYADVEGIREATPEEIAQHFEE